MLLRSFSVYVITRWCYFCGSVVITRWRYCLSAAMIIRWHYYIDVVMIARWRYCIDVVMITRWQYCLTEAMITRWHYCISVEIVTGWVHWIVMCLIANNFRLQEENINISKPQGKTTDYENGMSITVREERQVDRNREKGDGGCIVL